MKEFCLGIIAGALFIMGMMSVNISANTDRIADALEIIASPPEG